MSKLDRLEIKRKYQTNTLPRVPSIRQVKRTRTRTRIMMKNLRMRNKMSQVAQKMRKRTLIFPRQEVTTKMSVLSWFYVRYVTDLSSIKS